ncbi:XdhC family protein [Rhodococcus sp. IEGM 1408]|uniref:XdhC family protein n=1 Tax=Rhodococcus sp. IEGM 1408 TaxID=3082220 RepID=UPI002954E812|nr:XdhC family protein [Rhodococcus sp. IEGM 1408]MDV8001515.1 XdhC family protein [Rhodococcus sp. IEGM 1408]
MDIVAETLVGWRAAGQCCALARVLGTGRSAPLAPGSAMAVSDTGELIGGVSGGCVDAAVYSICQEVIADGRPTTAVFGPDGHELFSVGPTCGGTIEVLVEPIGVVPGLAGAASDLNGPIGVDARLCGVAPHPIDRVVAARQQGRAVVVATVVDGPCAGEWAVWDGDDDEVPQWARGPVAEAVARTGGIAATPADTATDPDPATDPTAATAAAATAAADPAADPDPAATTANTAVLEVPVAGAPARVFVQALTPPRLLVFGATAFAEALVPLGALLGYQVTVCDARPVFARPERFPAAAEVVRCWPHEFLRRTPVDSSTAICVLTHDPRFDVPLLVEALRTNAGYIGAMGSRRTHTERVQSLRAEGLAEADLQRLSSPIGLDLGARTAAGTALSIAAELVAHHRGGTGARLRDSAVAIHR